MGETTPTAPQYSPRGKGSQAESSSWARTFGVPVTDAGGKVASMSSALVTPGVVVAWTVETRCQTPGAGWTLPERRKFRFRLEDVAFD